MFGAEPPAPQPMGTFTDSFGREVVWDSVGGQNVYYSATTGEQGMVLETRNGPTFVEGTQVLGVQGGTIHTDAGTFTLLGAEPSSMDLVGAAATFYGPVAAARAAAVGTRAAAFGAEVGQEVVGDVWQRTTGLPWLDPRDLGSVRTPTGAFDPPSAAPRPHGNSLSSTQPNHVYVIVDTSSGSLVKPGVSGRPLTSTGMSPRANEQVSILNRTDPGRYKSVVVEQNVSRPRALEIEQLITDKHGARNHGAMPSPIHQRPRPQVQTREEFIDLYGFPDNRPQGGRY